MDNSKCVSFSLFPVPPSSITIENIEKHNGTDIIRGREDTTLTLTCSADGAKPEPNITWARSDTNETFNATIDIQKYSNSTFAVSSAIEIVPNRYLDGVVLLCIVSHQTLDYPSEKSVVLYLDCKYIG